MKSIEILQIGLFGVLGLMIVALIFAPLPIGGMGFVPVIGVSWIVLMPIMPVVIILLAASFVLSGDTEDVTHYSMEDSWPQSHQSQPHNQSVSDEPETAFDTREPVEIIREQYENDEITHEEYEKRLSVLLDVDDEDELRERLEWVSKESDSTAKR